MRPSKQQGQPERHRSDLAVERWRPKAAGRLTSTTTALFVCMPIRRQGPERPGRQDNPLQRAASARKQVPSGHVTESPRRKGPQARGLAPLLCAGGGSSRRFGPSVTTVQAEVSTASGRQTVPGASHRQPHRWAAAQWDQHREPSRRPAATGGKPNQRWKGRAHRRQGRQWPASRGSPPPFFRQQALPPAGPSSAEHEQTRRWPPFTRPLARGRSFVRSTKASMRRSRGRWRHSRPPLTRGPQDNQADGAARREAPRAAARGTSRRDQQDEDDHWASASGRRRPTPQGGADVHRGKI